MECVLGRHCFMFLDLNDDGERVRGWSSANVCYPYFGVLQQTPSFHTSPKDPTNSGCRRSSGYLDLFGLRFQDGDALLPNMLANQSQKINPFLGTFLWKSNPLEWHIPVPYIPYMQVSPSVIHKAYLFHEKMTLGSWPYFFQRKQGCGGSWWNCWQVCQPAVSCKILDPDNVHLPTRISLILDSLIFQCLGLNQLKGILLDVEKKVLSEFANFFFHIFVALLLAAHFRKEIRLKSFQYEMRAIFKEKLVHRILFNIHSSLLGAVETH